MLLPELHRWHLPIETRPDPRIPTPNCNPKISHSAFCSDEEQPETVQPPLVDEAITWKQLCLLHRQDRTRLSLGMYTQTNRQSRLTERILKRVALASACIYPASQLCTCEYEHSDGRQMEHT